MDLKIEKFVNNIAIGAIGAVPVTPQPVITGWPVGDVLGRALVLRFYGTLTPTYTATLQVVGMQVARLIQNLVFGTNLHYNLIENGTDGLSLYRMLSLANKRDLYFADMPATQASTVPANVELLLKIPFLDFDAARAWDMALDIITAQPFLRSFLNSINGNTVGTAAGGGGAGIVGNLNLEISLEMSRGPFVNKSGQPAFLTVAPNYGIYYHIFPFNVTATRAQTPIYLPYGDRIYKRMFIFQRDSVTLNELNNTIVGVNQQDRLSLKLNGIPIIDQVAWLALQSKNRAEYAPATLPPGAAIIDFHEKMTDSRIRGARLSNDLNLITPGQQTFELDIDCTNPGGSPYLYIGIESVRPLSDIAKRPEQMQPRTKAAKAASAAGASAPAAS